MTVIFIKRKIIPVSYRDICKPGTSESNYCSIKQILNKANFKWKALSANTSVTPLSLVANLQRQILVLSKMEAWLSHHYPLINSILQNKLQLCESLGFGSGVVEVSVKLDVATFCWEIGDQSFETMYRFHLQGSKCPWTFQCGHLHHLKWDNQSVSKQWAQTTQ